MKSILNFKKKMPDSTNISKLNGISSKKSKPSLLFYCIAIFTTNLVVYFISSTSSPELAPEYLKKANYSEVILTLELKTPFKTGKQISICDDKTLKTYHNVYFIKQVEDSDSFDKKPGQQVVLFVPNQLIAELTQSKLLSAVPLYSSFLSRRKTIVRKENYEIIY